MSDGRILSVIEPNSTVEERGMFNFNSAEELFARGELAKAFSVHMLSAREGFAPCQCSIGYAYEFGEGVALNLEESFRWYKMAADQNFPDAQYNLYLSYLQGTGVEKNNAEAMKYLEKAANNGHPAALHNLACKYERDGDKTQAFACYKKAAEAGFPISQYNLGICYLNGDGTNRDQEKAIHWFRIAARNGVEESINLLRSNGLM